MHEPADQLILALERVNRYRHLWDCIALLRVQLQVLGLRAGIECTSLQKLPKPASLDVVLLI